MERGVHRGRCSSALRTASRTSFRMDDMTSMNWRLTNRLPSSTSRSGGQNRRLATMILVGALTALPGLAFGQSQKSVAGLEIQHTFPFREDAEFSARAFEVAKAANPKVRSVQVFDTQTLLHMSGGSGSFHVVKTAYEEPQRETLEQLFEKAFRFVSDSGAKVLSKSYEPIPNERFDSGRFSFEADQGDWRLGGEMILIVDRQRAIQWLVQFVFGRQRISSLASPSLDNYRRHARNVLASTKVAE
jgi:hypothetical protein